MKWIFLFLSFASVGCVTQTPASKPKKVSSEMFLREEPSEPLGDVETTPTEPSAAKNQIHLNEKAAIGGAKDSAPHPALTKPMIAALATEVLGRFPLIESSVALTYANTVGQYMAQEVVPNLKCQSSGLAAADVRVAIVRSSTPVSFSIPGGLIFITTALMQKMASEDEFAGVIANEMVSSICENGLPPNLAAQAATGWSGYAQQISQMPISKTDLIFADRYALVALYRRGYDLTPYVTFISKNETAGRHGFGSERAALLQKNIAATPRVVSTAASRLPRFKAAQSKAI